MATLSRAEALTIITELFPHEPTIVTLGATVRELIATVGKRENNFYVLDSMGLPVAIGLGIALGRSENAEKVVVIEGDGGLLMGLSSLTTVGFLQPKNLVILVLPPRLDADTDVLQPLDAHDSSRSSRLSLRPVSHAGEQWAMWGEPNPRPRGKGAG
ncbi:MAG: hypothetical protein LC748_08945, partial [Thermomicrobia bacterium]|nr:hypothetical protein [Thermomicrobia bacterium]